VNWSRRDFLQLVAGAAGLAGTPRIAAAADYPSRPVRLLVGFAAGGAADVSARLMGQWLSHRHGQQFVIENRVGAGGNIATEEVVRAAPDGYTLLLCAIANAINATLYPKLSFDFDRDMTAVAGLLRLPDVLLINPLLPVRSVPAFIDYAKANPGRINFGSAGTGTSEHLAGEMFKIMAGVDMVHVPYRGGAPALTALMGGQVHTYFCASATALAGIKSNLIPLAVSTAQRWEELPDIPTLNEFVPGYEISTWFGLAAPKAVSSQIVASLNGEINAGLTDPTIVPRLKAIGGTPLRMTPNEFAAFIATETEKWAKVIREAKITVG
jgi:tripartite-type tricarboxylate transporter receptor subunit TctC